MVASEREQLGASRIKSTKEGTDNLRKQEQRTNQQIVQETAKAQEMAASIASTWSTVETHGRQLAVLEERGQSLQQQRETVLQEAESGEGLLEAEIEQLAQLFRERNQQLADYRVAFDHLTKRVSQLKVSIQSAHHCVRPVARLPRVSASRCERPRSRSVLKCNDTLVFMLICLRRQRLIDDEAGGESESG